MNAGPSSVPTVAFGEINVICRDLDAALAFYRDALGLVEVEREGDAVRLALGPVTLLLLPVATAMRDPRAYPDEATISFDLVVDDVAGTVVLLEGAGGQRIDVIDEGAGWAVADPDGNVIEVIGRVA